MAEKLHQRNSEYEDLCLGEWTRSLDERFRLSLPAETIGLFAPNEKSGEETDEQSDDQNKEKNDVTECVLAKERPGCVSLWKPSQWEAAMADGVNLIASKISSGRLLGRVNQVQLLGRLLSTRHRTVPIAGRGRIAIPESFRDFLEVEPGGNLMLVGAAVCLEIWHPQRWSEHIGEQMPGFRDLFDQLAS